MEIVHSERVNTKICSVNDILIIFRQFIRYWNRVPQFLKDSSELRGIFKIPLISLLLPVISLKTHQFWPIFGSLTFIFIQLYSKFTYFGTFLALKYKRQCNYEFVEADVYVQGWQEPKLRGGGYPLLHTFPPRQQI